MQIGKFRELRSLRQPTTLSTRRTRDISASGPMEGQRLVFLYPMLYDQKFQTKINDLRDFFAVSYVGEIKISNALNITSDSYNIGMPSHESKVINPAQLVRQSIWSTVESRDRAYDAYIKQSLYGYNKSEYQERINQFNAFIKNQLEHDPRYSKLRPILSTIVVENLINIPLIVGTHSYQVDSIYLYFVLLTALAYNIPIDNRQNVTRIFNIIDIMDKKNFTNLLFDNNTRDKFNKLIGYDNSTNLVGNELKPQIRNKYKPITRRGWSVNTNINQTEIRKIGGWINTERDKARVFFDLVLDIDRWSAANNHIESRNSININDLSIPTSIQSKHYQRAISSFSHYVENCIVPIFYGIDLIAGPTHGGVSISEKIDGFLDAVINDLDDEYIKISTIIVKEIKSQYSETDTKMANRVHTIIDLCEENLDIGNAIKKQLEKLDSALDIPSTFSGGELNNFYSTVVKTASQFESRQKTIDSWLKELSKAVPTSDIPFQRTSPQLTNIISNVLDKFKRIVADVLWNNFPKGSQFGNPWLTVIRNRAQFVYRYTNFCTAILGVDMSNIVGTFGAVNDRAMNEFYRMMHEIEHSIVSLLTFFFKWNFFSYTCSYMTDIEVDIEIQRKDALEFPNYCIVLPLELFKGLYMTSILRNFDKIMRQQIADDTYGNIDVKDVLSNVGDMTHLINMVNSKLKIPNLILIDEKSNTCYYKFMFMTKAIKINLNTMQQFINHQKDILPGF